MAYLNDVVLDAAVQVLDTNVDALHICSAEPATYADIATYTLGNKTAPVISVPQDRTEASGGREVEMAAFSDGSVTATGTATHFAWVDDVGNVLYIAQALSASQSVTSGNTFSLDAHAVGIPDVV